MKNKYKYRKDFEALADRVGLLGDTVLTGQKKTTLQEGYFVLVNNKKRFVKGLLKLSLDEQKNRLKELTDRVKMAEAEHRYNQEQKKIQEEKQRVLKNDLNRARNSEQGESGSNQDQPV
jgi:hypothetical protein